MDNQIYEKYWKLTVEYTDINEDNFKGTLQLIVDFIDNNDTSIYSKKFYKELQIIIYNKYPKVDGASIRKSINQFIKLGFINNGLKSYHYLTKYFLEAKSNNKRKNLFSNIFYTNSKLSSSVTKPSEVHQINFLIKTLEEVGTLTKNDIEGLMTIDISTIEKGYFTKKEVEKAKKYANSICFSLRKYNQVGYLFNFLNKLNDVIFVKNKKTKEAKLYFTDDAKRIFGNDYSKTKQRDPYLHRLYKNQLKEETDNKLKQTQCMLEKLSYPSLVASHIKPFIMSDDNEAYDPNNGLLLSRNMDILFDQGYISFENNGNIICSPRLNQDVKNHLKNCKLDNIFINEKRIQYLDYHRNNILKRAS
jgi:hypothetical protein